MVARPYAVRLVVELAEDKSLDTKPARFQGADTANTMAMRCWALGVSLLEPGRYEFGLVPIRGYWEFNALIRLQDLATRRLKQGARADTRLAYPHPGCIQVAARSRLTSNLCTYLSARWDPCFRFSSPWFVSVLVVSDLFPFSPSSQDLILMEL